MEEGYRVPLNIQISRRFLRLFFRALFNTLGKVELFGLEKIPDDNRYVVAFNHVSMVEVPFIGAYWPTILEIIGATVVWERPLHALVARGWSGIQVYREGFDREVFQRVVQVFDAGRPLMISPEGTRSRTPGMLRGKPGIAYIVDKVQVPVIPVAVVGNTYDFVKDGFRGKKPPLKMIVGDLIHLPPLTGKGEAKRQMRQQNTDYIMARIAELLPPEYRGVYSDYQRILDGHPLDPE
jgi:1-acyl-sn-glycerol-3-phosphate acyltransferase